MPGPLDEHRRENACREEERHDGDVDDHGRVALARVEAAGGGVEEGLAGDEGRRGEEGGGRPRPGQGGRHVQAGDEAAVDAVQQQGEGDRPRSVGKWRCEYRISKF